MTTFLSGILFLLTIAQGGYYYNAYMAAGALLCAWLFLRPKVYVPKKAAIAFISLILAFFISSAFNGGIPLLVYSLRIVTWFLFYMAVSSLSADELVRLKKNAFIIAAAVACISIIGYTGIIELWGYFTNGRLQGPFQYANAAGIYFALILFIDAGSGKLFKRLRTFIICAFLLTLSFGAFLAFGVGEIVLLYKTEKAKRGELLVSLFAELFAAGLSAAALWYARNIAGGNTLATIAALIMMIAAAIFADRIPALAAKKVFGYFSLISCIAGCAALLMLRGGEAWATFIERCVQMKDGLSAMIKNPLLGIGPGNWAVMKEQYQSSSYQAQVIHNSFVQAGVDGGIGALAALMAGALLSFKEHIKDKAACAAFCSFLLHGLLDLSFLFTSIPCTLTVIISSASKKELFNIPRNAILASGSIIFISYITLYCVIGG